MQKHLELSDPTSCLNRARIDEMLFVLLDRDESSPYAIREWIETRIRKGKSTRNSPEIVSAEQAILKLLEIKGIDFQQLGSTTLKGWTADKPDKDGWYWWTAGLGQGKYMAYVKEGHMVGYSARVPVSEVLGEWYGPLQGPGE